MQQLVLRVAIVVIGCFVLSGTLAGQSRDDLRRRYGQPQSETFVVRPGIEVTAMYAKDGRVTELMIVPETPDLIKSRGNGLSLDSINAIIDELVPLSARGKPVVKGFINARCLPADDCVGSSQDYENVTIYYNAAPEGRVYYAVVRWNDKVTPRPL